MRHPHESAGTGAPRRSPRPFTVFLAAALLLIAMAAPPVDAQNGSANDDGTARTGSPRTTADASQQTPSPAPSAAPTPTNPGTVTRTPVTRPTVPPRTAPTSTTAPAPSTSSPEVSSTLPPNTTTSEQLALDPTAGEGSLPSDVRLGDEESVDALGELKVGDEGTIVVDPDGDGVIEPTDLNGDGVIDLVDADGDGIVDPIDLDGDGIIDALDRDGDGRLDPGDLDGDGKLDAIDLDGDGEPDVLPTDERALYAAQQALAEVQAQAAAEAEAKRVEAQVKLDQLAPQVDDARARLEQAVARRDQLVDELDAARTRHRQLQVQLEAAEDVEVRHAVNTYVAGGSSNLTALALSTDVKELSVTRVYADAVLRDDHGQVARLSDMVSDAAIGVALLETDAAVARDDWRLARQVSEVIDELYASQQVEAAVYAAGGQLFVAGFVFPVGDPYQFIDSFGFPRMMGTSYAHWHEGADIMAPMGTPLYATENGVIDNQGVGTLGGNKLWIVGDSTTEYYYAHLSGFADGIANGVRVEAGQLVGFVGDTGNAKGTPPHLHFEIHPGGGDAINPYAILAAAASIEQELRTDDGAVSESAGVETDGKPGGSAGTHDEQIPARDPDELNKAAGRLLARESGATDLVVGGPVYSDPSKPNTDPGN